MKTQNVSVSVEFTQEQYVRLSQAVAFLGRGVSVESLAVAGTMSLLDFSASNAKDARDAIRGTVRNYADKKATFVEGDAVITGVQFAPEAGRDAEAFFKALDAQPSGRKPRVTSGRGGKIVSLVNAKGKSDRWLVTPEAISRLAS